MFLEAICVNLENVRFDLDEFGFRSVQVALKSVQFDLEFVCIKVTNGD